MHNTLVPYLELQQLRVSYSRIKDNENLQKDAIPNLGQSLIRGDMLGEGRTFF
jgi:hypothetical protein